jgi:hypothetical protein
MGKRPKNDHAIFFRLPSAVVEQIDSVAFDLGCTRTQFIRQAILRALRDRHQ